MLYFLERSAPTFLHDPSSPLEHNWALVLWHVVRTLLVPAAQFLDPNKALLLVLFKSARTFKVRGEQTSLHRGTPRVAHGRHTPRQELLPSARIAQLVTFIAAKIIYFLISLPRVAVRPWTLSAVKCRPLAQCRFEREGVKRFNSFANEPVLCIECKMSCPTTDVNITRS